MLGWLNQNSGLFSLLAVLASVIVPIVIFKKQRKDDAEKERLAEQKRIQEKRQEELDWQEAAKRAHESPFPISEGTIKDRIDNEFRKIRSERILQRRY